MADPNVVARSLQLMWTATKPQTALTDDESARYLAAFAPQLRDRTDEAVKRAANEWIATERFFPKLAEFLELARKHDNAIADNQRALSPAAEAVQHWPVGKPGREGLAAQIVMLRMMRAVAEQCPQGFWGRLVYGNDERHAMLQPEEGRAERIKAYTTIAYEQAVDFEDSTLTWDRWPY